MLEDALMVSKENRTMMGLMIMAIRMQLIAEQWEWQMGHLTLIRLRMC